jgi:cold shock protein
MTAGILKMWNADRGFGFIQNDAGGAEVFLHVTALQDAGIEIDEIRKGIRLTFEVENTGDGKTKAGSVRLA